MTETSDTPVLRCAWCRKPIKRTGKRGPAPTYCTDNNGRCRVAAHRAREGYAEWAEEHDVMVPEPLPVTTAPIDEQAARTVLEARTLAGVSLRLGTEIHPLAWRFTHLGDGLNALIDKLFPDERTT